MGDFLTDSTLAEHLNVRSKNKMRQTTLEKVRKQPRKEFCNVVIHKRDYMESFINHVHLIYVSYVCLPMSFWTCAHFCPLVQMLSSLFALSL